MTTGATTDHAAGCGCSWCTAHHDDGLCHCPYAQASPHRAEHSATPPTTTATTRGSVTVRDITAGHQRRTIVAPTISHPGREGRDGQPHTTRNRPASLTFRDP